MALAKEIEKSVESIVKDKEVAIAFSGGIDSTTLAFLSKKYASSISLYTVGFSNSEDISYSIEISKKLGLPLNLYLLTIEESKRLYEFVEQKFSLGFLKSEILAPIQKIFELAKEEYVLFGSGSEELFAGYDRYYSWKKEELVEKLSDEYSFLLSKGDVHYVKELAKINEKKALFPFCNDNIKEIAFSFSAEELLKDKERKKYVLREAAKLLGVPVEAINRKKKALQYGSGVHKKLLKLRKSNEL